MGILQKLLGRRGDEPAKESHAEREPNQPEGTPLDPPTGDRPSSSVLGDAAPLPEETRAVQPESSLPDASSPPAPNSSETVAPSDGEPRESTIASTVSDQTTPAASDTETAQVTQDNYFVPERPRRELLTLEPPPPPEDGLRTGNTAALPLDVAGSPRAALRDAGITVPHMQKIVQRGDVQLWAFGVRASEALGWWLQARQVHDKTGWLPVLLGSADDWLDNGESVLHEGEDELSRLGELDAGSLLADKAAEAGEPPRGVPILPTRGDSDFAVPKTDGLLGLVQADYGWQIPALLPWKGSTNWELYGAEHAAVLRSWHERYEVELVSMTWDILELYVPNPPTADEDVLTAASEVHAYCPDLLAAGVPTLDDLAVHMIRSRAWYFRWT
ncbi:uncharacterized protein DUF4253 [Stackebrandtia endophytica]|uniref:Uncharacterized protein DUF4253 n=1 Tax=Stackebrandtia endophytica TaxID=1496996 RepID=A0A543AYN6_9ACTN|nr:DUF4253 domain-containing protein [Stackebrandtia endophytica]TQL77691.1 uncharacterized protein DUF4253 [Stackebrandtia endophytica]